MELLDTPQNDTPLHSHPISSNPPHSDPPLRQNGLFNSWNESGIGRKRSYNNLNNLPDDPASQLQAEFEAAAEKEDGYTPKKSRGSEWLMSPKTEATGSKSSRSSKRSSLYNRLRKGKPSKFIEGSMRDRESDIPPDEFLREEMAMEWYNTGKTDEDVTPNQVRPRISVDTSAGLDAGIERSRPSSMYRFGKALANAFNPANVWFMFKDKSESPIKSPTEDALQQRKLMAEQQYAELKKAGFQGTNKFTSARSSTDHSNRDSGIDMSSLHSHDLKRDGMVFDQHGIPLLPPPPIPDDGMPSPGLVSSDGSIHDSAKLQYKRRPSIPSIKKMKSHFSMSNLKHDPALPLSSVEHNDQASRIKKQRSKKDLQKQQKLSKKISNLETQLDKARKELNKTIGVDEVAVKMEKFGENDDEQAGDIVVEDEHERNAWEDGQEIANDVPEHRSIRPSATPGRRYVPSLPSLPSERILFEQAKKSQIPGSKYSPMELPPKTVNPNPLALAMEQMLGMHDEVAEETPLRKKPISAVMKKKDAEKRTTSKKTPTNKAISAATTTSESLAARTGVKKAVTKASNQMAAKGKPKTITQEQSTTTQVYNSTSDDDECEGMGQVEIDTATEQPAKKVMKKRRRSSASKTDRLFRPGEDDDDEEEWKEASQVVPKKVSRRISSRNLSAAVDATNKQKEATTSLQGKKENTKPGQRARKSSKAALANEDPLGQNKQFSNDHLDFSLATPSAKSTSILGPIVSPSNTDDDQALFADATAFAADTPNAVHANGNSTEGSHASALAPIIPISSETMKRIRRSMSPPPTSTFSKLSGQTIFDEHQTLESVLEDAREARAVRGTSPTAIPLPRGSPVRGRRHSPKPGLKRAGHDGPIRVTPGKGNSRGIPPVPKVPSHVVGKRPRVEKPAHSEASWDGWDEDVF